MPQSQYDSADDAFFAAVGRLALAWGMIDSCLEVLCLVIFNDFGGRGIERELPWSLSRKIKFLRRCFAHIEIFKGGANAAVPLLDRASEGVQVRHDIIHGVLLSSPAPGQPTKMARLLRAIQPYNRTFSITTDQILAHAKDATDLGGRLMNVALGLAEFARTRTEKGN
jgi:hypothetical protein